MKRATFWLLTLFFSISCLAQHSWEVKHLPGFLVPHNANMYNMMAHIQGVEVGRQWRLDSGGNIDRRQQQPLVGVALTYFALGNQINGKGYCLHGFYEVGQRLFRRTSVRARLSVGVGYLSRQFDVFGNPQNRAIGSHVNGFMQATIPPGINLTVQQGPLPDTGIKQHQGRRQHRYGQENNQPHHEQNSRKMCRA